MHSIGTEDAEAERFRCPGFCYSLSLAKSVMHYVKYISRALLCQRKQAVRVATQYPRIYSPGGTCSGMLAIYDISNKLTFDLLTLKVVSESRVTWATQF